MNLAIFRWLRLRFNLAHDMAEPADIVADVEEGMVFRGTNLWVLIFAILVASVGLNVNSTAVVIGAMLISPLMGPIVGIGFGAATVEIGMIRRGAKNLLLAASISLLVSAAYFRLTPLTDAGSARSPPPGMCSSPCSAEQPGPWVSPAASGATPCRAWPLPRP